MVKYAKTTCIRGLQPTNQQTTWNILARWHRKRWNNFIWSHKFSVKSWDCLRERSLKMSPAAAVQKPDNTTYIYANIINDDIRLSLLKVHWYSTLSALLFTPPNKKRFDRRFLLFSKQSLGDVAKCHSPRFWRWLHLPSREISFSFGFSIHGHGVNHLHEYMYK